MEPRRAVRTGNLLFALGVACGLVGAAVVERLLPSPDERDVAHYEEVRDFVRTSFVREVSDEELLDLALHGMLEGLDEYSRYYNGREARALERETEGRYEGIGAVFQSLEDGRILFTIPGSPAYEAGLTVGDEIETIDGVRTDEMTAKELVDVLGDPRRKKLEISAKGLHGERKVLTIGRESLVDPTVRHARILDAERGIGYVAITSFSHETDQEFDRAFDELEGEGMRALVLDLRGNRGGVLAKAVKVARRFITENPIVSTEGRGRSDVHEAVPSEAIHAGFPLVVLVDGLTASASEVLAAALQDHRNAVVVGSPTYGKGMVQTIHRFERRDAVAKVTSSYYYSPAHRNFEHDEDGAKSFGILPDVSVDLSRSERRALYEALERYSPPRESLELLRAWQEESGLPLVPVHPSEAMPGGEADAQLSAALALLSGHAPGPHDEDGAW